MAAGQPFQAGPFVWRDGRLNRVEDPSKAIGIPVLMQGLDYGRVIISGLRVTPHHQDPATLLIFSLADHVRRLLDSCQRLGLEMALSFDEICQAIVEVVEANASVLNDGGYLRAVAFDPRSMVAPQWEGPASLVIFTGPFDEYIKQGEFVATFDRQIRIGSQGQIKAAANYVAFAAAKKRAAESGAHDTIGLTVDRLGALIAAEGTTSNLLFVFYEEGKPFVLTPPLTAGILAGITRRRLFDFAVDVGFVVAEGDVALDEITFAREIGLCGTASYVAPFTHFGRHRLETVVLTAFNHYLRRVMRGEIPKWSHLNTAVAVSVPQQITLSVPS